MGKRGPAPMPTAIRVLHGENKPSRLNKDEPKPDGDRPFMPRDMTPGAKVVWRRTMRTFGSTRVIKPADAATFRRYCEAQARYERYQAILEREGPVVYAEKGSYRNPIHIAVQAEAALAAREGAHLGLDPSSRTGLKSDPKVATDPFKDWEASG